MGVLGREQENARQRDPGNWIDSLDKPEMWHIADRTVAVEHGQFRGKFEGPTTYIWRACLVCRCPKPLNGLPDDGRVEVGTGITISS